MIFLQQTAEQLLDTAAQRQSALVTIMNFVPLLIINTLSVWFITHVLYFKKSRNRLYYFTFILLSTAIFVLLFMAQGTKLQMGAALGLFAVFGILRYRTEQVNVREMTYLFYLVALSVANGTSPSVRWNLMFTDPVSLFSSKEFMLIFVVNIVFVAVAALMEFAMNRRHRETKLVKYDNIDLIIPEKREELKADLEKRLGIKITNIEVGAVDFLLDCCLLNVHYDPTGVDRGPNTVNQNIRMK